MDQNIPVDTNVEDTSGEEILVNPTNGLEYTKTGRIVCADCRTPIPRYREAPSGYVSPESDELKSSVREGIPVVIALERAVCQPCYKLAFQRVYPEAELPAMSAEVYE